MLKLKENLSPPVVWRFINEKFLFFITKILSSGIYNLNKSSSCWVNCHTSLKYCFPLIFFFKFNTSCQFNVLSDIVVYDTFNKNFRFTVVYILLSLKFFKRLRVIIKIKEGDSLISLRSLFSSSIWIEREFFDLFGIFVFLNMDLRRILTDYGFTSYPLRKDFPITGFFDLYYDDNKKRIVYFPLELMQIN